MYFLLIALFLLYHVKPALDRHVSPVISNSLPFLRASVVLPFPLDLT